MIGVIPELVEVRDRALLAVESERSERARFGGDRSEGCGDYDWVSWLKEETDVEIIREAWDSKGRKLQIVCPNVAEHSVGDRSGTFFGQTHEGRAWFRCRHAHCEERFGQDGDRGWWRNFMAAVGGESRSFFDSSEHKTGGSDESNFKVLPFLTGREIADSTPEVTEWVAYPWFAKSTITEVAGPIKKAGKTTFLAHATSKILEGEPFLGGATQKTKAIFLTEQPPTSFRRVVRDANLDRDDIEILYWHMVRGVQWEDLVRRVCDHAGETGAGLIIIDVISRWANFPGVEESSPAYADRVMPPLKEATARGLTVVYARHDRKAGGEVGESGRGTSQVGGDVDQLLKIRRGDGNARNTVRVIESVGRFMDETPEELAVELVNGEYVSLGDAKAFSREQARATILEVLPETPEHAIETKVVVDRCLAKGCTKTPVTDGLKYLTDRGDVVRLGKGKKGDPHRYCKASPSEEKEGEFVSSEPPPYSSEETNSRAPEEGWTDEELRMRRLVLSGETVRFDMHKRGPHARFRGWAEEQGKVFYIGRRNSRLGLEDSDWHNPFKEGVDGTREEVVRRFKEERMPELVAWGKDPEEYRGKALGCWCKLDEACHGDVLIDYHHDDSAHDGRFTHVTTPDQLAEAISKLGRATLVGLDLETVGTDPATGTLRLAQVSDGETTFVVDALKVDPKPLLVCVVDKEIIAHNALFELTWLKHLYDLEPQAVHDTMIMSQVLHAGEIPAHDHGLAEVAKRELGIEMDKSCQNSDWGSSELTAQQLEYAATDARILPALYKKLRGEEVGQ